MLQKYQELSENTPKDLLFVDFGPNNTDQICSEDAIDNHSIEIWTTVKDIKPIEIV